MSLRSLAQTQLKGNYKRAWFLFVSIFFVAWLVLSFILPVILDNYWGSFFNIFVDYLIYFQIISTLGFAYLLTGGHLSEVKNNIKLIIVFTAILVVLAFTYFCWTTLVTNYGQYGTYIDSVPASYLNYGVDSRFEEETIYREFMKYKYDTAFQQIWTFGGFVFISTFLLLMAIKKEENK